MTAERFMPDPFCSTSGARVYRTGDLVRYLPDGEIEFLGREDNQVKVQGHRIELGEIETLLTQHESIEAAVVTDVGELRGNKRLVAYVVTTQDQLPDFRTYLKDRLPEYMIPGTFIRLDALPLTANGKVNRNALPAPDPHAPLGSNVLQKRFHQGGLADPWLAGDEDDLALAVPGLL